MLRPIWSIILRRAMKRHEAPRREKDNEPGPTPQGWNRDLEGKATTKREPGP